MKEIVQKYKSKLYDIWRRRMYKNRVKVVTRGEKIGAVSIIFCMALCDFVTMNSLFSSVGMSDIVYVNENVKIPISTIIMQALLMACVLEGIPTYMGMNLTSMIDTTIYRKNDRRQARVGFAVATIFLLAAFALQGALRYLIIENGGGYEAFLDGNYLVNGETGENNNFIGDICLIFTPILTSALAFLASWTVLSPDMVQKQEHRVNKCYELYLLAQSEFRDALLEDESNRMALWSSLNAPDETKGSSMLGENPADKMMPGNFDEFRETCFRKSRAKLINNCIVQYPEQIKRYNTEIENFLELCIAEMSKYTTVPQEILKLDLAEIIEEYDNEKLSNHEWDKAWAWNNCSGRLEDRLKNILDNAIIIAQFKMGKNPYYVEGED